MRINYVEMENVRSHKDTAFNIAGQGMTFIKGANGSGKSTIVKAIIFCLFGIGADSIVNESIGKNARVTLTGMNGDDKFTVERYRKHTEHKNNLYFYINDAPVPAATNTALQKKLEDYIGLDYRAFLNIASFSSEMLMFAAATDAERKAIFEKILQDLEVYNEYHEEAKEALLKRRTSKDAAERIIEIESRELEVTEKFLQSEKKKAADEEARVKQKLLKLNQRLAELQKTQTEYEVLSAKNERYRNAANRLHHWLEANEDPSNRWAENRGDIVRAKQYLELLDGGHCGTCNQKIDTKHRLREKKRVENGIELLENLDKELTRLCDAYEAVQDKLDKLNRKEVRFIQKNAKYEDLAERIAMTEDEISELSSDFRKYLGNPKLKKKVLKLKKGITKFKKMLKQEEDHIVYLEEVVKGFSKQGIPNVIIARALSTLEERANGYLDILTSGTLGLSFSGFSLTKKGGVRNKIGIDVVSESGVSSFDSYSGGERQRLNIAILLALRDVAEMNKGVKLNCLFLDEVLDLSLDEGGIEEVLLLLRAKSEAVESIFVISPKASIVHNTSVEFDNVYTVRKRRGFSEINQ